MNNNDYFNITALEIFHRCTCNFPMDATFTPDEVAESVSGFFTLDGINIQQLKQMAWATSDWLVKEGFLRDVASGDTRISVALTHKGLNATNSVPSSISGKKSYSEVFAEGISAFAPNVAAGLMVEFFKNGS